MEKKQLESLLSAFGLNASADWSELEDERTMTIHIASSGVAINLTKIRGVKVDGDLLLARNEHEDTSGVLAGDVVGLSVEGEGKGSRKAGFR